MYSPPPTVKSFTDLQSNFAGQNYTARGELRGWALLGIGVLALAGLMALLIAVSRIPGIENINIWPIGFFKKGLVAHVIFSFVVWFFAVFGALLSLTIRSSSNHLSFERILSFVALRGAIISCLLLAVPAFLSSNTVSLNNYVPVIIDPLFYTGLIILGFSLFVHVIRFVINRSTQSQVSLPLITAVGCAAFIFFISLTCLGLAGAELTGEKPDEAFNEHLFWGFGHVLQFLNVALLIGAWLYLAEACKFSVPPIYLKVAVALLCLAVIAAPVFYFVFETFSAEQQFAFTNLQYALAPPTLLIALALLYAVARHGGPYPWRDPAFLCLSLSILVFGVGGALGLFVDGADTRTPAHYHGVIAGINLAFMGLYYTLILPLLGRAIEMTKIVYAQIYLFAGGQTLAAVGLFWAGGYGAPRKVAGADQGLDAIGGYAGMMMNGVGALIAITGGILFIWTVASALLKKQNTRNS